jgi:hypothetical protein
LPSLPAAPLGKNAKDASLKKLIIQYRFAGTIRSPMFLLP